MRTPFPFFAIMLLVTIHPGIKSFKEGVDLEKDKGKSLSGELVVVVVLLLMVVVVEEG